MGVNKREWLKNSIETLTNALQQQQAQCNKKVKLEHDLPESDNLADETQSQNLSDKVSNTFMQSQLEFSIIDNSPILGHPPAVQKTIPNSNPETAVFNQVYKLNMHENKFSSESSNSGSSSSGSAKKA